MTPNVPRIVQPSQWLEMVGMGTLQDYQDCFSREMDIPIHLLDRNGKSLLIPSKKLFFCDFVEMSSHHKCSGVNRIDVKEVASWFDKTHSFEPLVKCCDYGIASFLAPIYFNGELIAFWHCSGFTFDDSPHSKQLNLKFDLPILSHEDFSRAINSLTIVCRLLDIHFECGVISEEPMGPKCNPISDLLTQRENEVATLVCSGMSNAQIANRLFVSEKTVKTHLSNILSKLGLKNRVQLICEFAPAALDS